MHILPSPRRLLPYLVVGGVLACRGTTLTHIDVDGADRVTVEAGTVLEELLGDLGFEAFTQMNVVASEELQNQGVEPGDIKEARLVSFELEAIEPADADLSFLDAMTLLVLAPGLPEEVVASAPGFPQGEALVVFDLEEVDLTEYIVSESMTLTTDVSGQRPDRATRIEARYVVEVGVTVKGATRKRD